MKNKKLSWKTAKRVLRYIGRYKILLAFSLLLAATSVAMTLYVPILIGDTVDIFATPSQGMVRQIAPNLIKIAMLVIATAIAQWLMNTINNRITYHVVRDVRNDAFEKIQKLPFAFLDRQSVGDTVSRMIADVDQFADGLLLGFTQFFSGVLTIIGTVVFMLYIHPGIAILVVVLTPMSLLIAKFIASRTHKFFAEQSKTRGAQTAFINEMVGNAHVVHAFSRESILQEEFDGTNEKLNKISVKATFFSSLVNPATRLFNSVIYATVGLFGCFAVLGNFMGMPLSIGMLSGLLAYTTQYTKPFNEISGIITELQNALTCAERVFELLDEQEETPDPMEASESKEVRGTVAIDAMSFSYVPERPLIQNLNLYVAEGKRVAIVGPTGCGKTTFINLLMRFYDPQSGSISVDETDIRSMKRHDLRRRYGMVLQETYLFSGSVKDNIRLSRPDATDEEIENAARAAHAHSFIKRLPQGYDTIISENGENLSAGEKQLLCIARVMLSLPPMLILDEATSSIDTLTEIRIQKAFADLMQGRTSFVVAHRLSTIREADIILVMDSGNIVEQGTHEELLAQEGFYAKLYNSQFEKA